MRITRLHIENVRSPNGHPEMEKMEGLAVVHGIPEPPHDPPPKTKGILDQNQESQSPT